MRFKPPDPVGTRRNNQASKFFSLLFNHTLIYPSHIQIRSAWTVPASDVQLIDHVGQCQGPAQTVQSLDNDNPSQIRGEIPRSGSWWSPTPDDWLSNMD